MTDREAVFLAIRDVSIASLIEHALNLPVVASDNNIPVLDEGRHYWCFVDWLLPDISGLEICRQLRENPTTRHAHITMLLEEDDIDSKKRALRHGADDYLVGFAHADRLIARLCQYRAAQQPATPGRFAQGDLQVDLASYLVRHKGQAIMLAPNEFRLLAHFVENPDKVYSRASLIALLRKDDAQIDERTVDVWIGRLRRALKTQGVPDRLRTVRSMGYVFDGAES